MGKLTDTALIAIARRRRRDRRHFSPDYFTIVDLMSVTGATRLQIINLERDGFLPETRRDADGTRIWTDDGLETATRIVRRHLEVCQ